MLDCQQHVDSTLLCSLQDYFAGLLVEQIKQQSPGQSPKQTLQAVLANLQSLYQHNQLIFQVSRCQQIAAATLCLPLHLSTSFDKS